ncbi:hypothetical protein CIHG_02144 [Coccidioides immitis H538.4]|uniref:Uncharacterized protein n=3 Tax=Coccidioides immitis TaxID=5501 RepID=A0A0J8RCW4_COCIT|nr:hypothetical protein CIRG_00316 [Coccidioides immitis RMSCC 2394]KMU81738.1 hypothetical protein CISG_02756 [Coccidioides immitis RMSCC 3703]KMU84359.1 hypothetical protein CIHG_02144 [Coccidioides immitis H538.4]
MSGECPNFRCEALQWRCTDSAPLNPPNRSKINPVRLALSGFGSAAFMPTAGAEKAPMGTFIIHQKNPVASGHPRRQISLKRLYGLDSLALFCIPSETLSLSGLYVNRPFHEALAGFRRGQPMIQPAG